MNARLRTSETSGLCLARRRWKESKARPQRCPGRSSGRQPRPCCRAGHCRRAAAPRAAGGGRAPDRCMRRRRRPSLQELAEIAFHCSMASRQSRKITRASPQCFRRAAASGKHPEPGLSSASASDDRRVARCCRTGCRAARGLRCNVQGSGVVRPTRGRNSAVSDAQAREIVPALPRHPLPAWRRPRQSGPGRRAATLSCSWPRRPASLTRRISSPTRT